MQNLVQTCYDSWMQFGLCPFRDSVYCMRPGVPEPWTGFAIQRAGG